MGHLCAWAHLRSSGREGSATGDRHVRFWSKSSRPQKLLNLAEACAQQVESDWKDYCRAYDKGVMSAPATAPRKRKGVAA